MSELIKNIVLVGRTGNGKSATGNSLIGENMFESKKQAVGVTIKCKMYRAAIQDGPIINVIDTPGLFDSDMFEELSKEIINCLAMAEEGIHAVLLVLSAKNRVSQEEESTINTLQRIFDSKILDYFIIVFTGGDELEEENQTLDDFFRAGCPEFLTNALRLCGGRKVMFNNRTTDIKKKAEQLKQLMHLVADVEKQTGGMPYTYQMHRNIKEKNDEKLREQERMIESKNRVEAEQALMHDKLRMEQEIIAAVEAGKNRMEQQRAIESKNRAEAELVVMREKLQMKKEKLRMQKEKINQLIAQVDEERRLKEKQMNEPKKIGIVYARDLSIAWSDNTSYWSWLPLPYATSSGSLVEAAVLKNVCWLSVNGNFDTIELTPATEYEVVYVVKLEDPTSGWETPVNLKLTLPDSSTRPQEHSVSLKEHIGKQWVDIPAGEFMMSAENTGEISFSLYETDTGAWKKGLFVKGVEIRPKNKA